MSKSPEAIKVFNDYYGCPCCSKGANVVNEAAIYHVSSFTHDPFECKDCRQEFKLPPEVKINKPKQFKRNKRKKQENER